MRELSMETKQKCFTKKKVIFLTVMTAFVYFISFLLLFDCGHFPFVPDWFWGQAGLFVIIGSIVAWILIMKVLVRKSVKVRIVLTLFGLSVIAAVLTWWIMENSSISIHMFG